MIFRLSLISLLFLVVAFSACRKTDFIPIPMPIVLGDTVPILEDEQPMTQGAYWIYSTNIYNDSTGEVIESDSWDSIVVAGMEEIDGRQYTVFAKYDSPSQDQPTVEYRRFSADTLFNNQNEILLISGRKDGFLIEQSNPNSTVKISKTLDSAVVVNGSIYTASAMHFDITQTIGPQSYQAKTRRFYSPEIGLVRYDYQYAGQPEKKYRRELLRYSIQP